MKSSFVVNRTKTMMFVFGNTMFFVVQSWRRINNVKSIEMIEMIEMVEMLQSRSALQSRSDGIEMLQSRSAVVLHRTHARNDAGALCASLTMRREIGATRRAGATTSMIKMIPPKGKQCALHLHQEHHGDTPFRKIEN
jgi:hypothetical protein